MRLSTTRKAASRRLLIPSRLDHQNQRTWPPTFCLASFMGVHIFLRRGDHRASSERLAAGAGCRPPISELARSIMSLSAIAASHCRHKTKDLCDNLREQFKCRHSAASLNRSQFRSQSLLYGTGTEGTKSSCLNSARQKPPGQFCSGTKIATPRFSITCDAAESARGCGTMGMVFGALYSREPSRLCCVSPESMCRVTLPDDPLKRKSLSRQAERERR
jgi:hypothetical protein